MNFDGPAIARATGGVLRGGDAVGPIATDTRSLPPGSWFLALVGDRFDAHALLDSAAGAAGGIFHRDPGPSWARPWVQVADTTVALHDLGRAARRRLVCPVVALTGSSGKTTTRALTALALAPLGRVHQTVGNLNNQIGVPLTLLAAPEDADAVVLEMGTSSPGEIAALVDIGQPDVRIVVNVGPAHLQELGGLDGVAREKGAMFRDARPQDVLLVNVDDPRVVAMEGAGRRVGWGRGPGADVQLVAHHVAADGWSARAVWRTPDGDVAATLPEASPHVAHDAAAALAAAWALGCDLRASARALEGYQPVGMRLSRVPLPNGAMVVNDAYNANPDSMRASLATLAGLPGRRTAVLGDMLELGADEARWHAEVAAHAAGLPLDRLVLVGPRMAAAADAARAIQGVPVTAFPAVDGVADWLASDLRPDDRLLLKASRGSRLERVLEDLRRLTDGETP